GQIFGSHGLFRFPNVTFSNLDGSKNYITMLASQAVDVTVGPLTVAGAPVALVSQLANYLPLTGGTVSGNLAVTGTITSGGTAVSLAGHTHVAADIVSGAANTILARAAGTAGPYNDVVFASSTLMGQGAAGYVTA